MPTRPTAAEPRVLPVLLRAAALGLTLAACGSSLPDGHVAVEGRLLDADTGEPVSRETVYVHLFCDALGVQESLEPEDATTYRAVLPGRRVRVRVYDTTSTYHRFEETITVEGDRRVFDVRLEPTGYVTLRGHVVAAGTGRALVRGGNAGAIGDHGPLFSFSDGSASLHTGLVSLDERGGYSLKVPRTVIRIAAVDTSLQPVEDRVDLTGFEGDVYEFDIRME